MVEPLVITRPCNVWVVRLGSNRPHGRGQPGNFPLITSSLTGRVAASSSVLTV